MSAIEVNSIGQFLVIGELSFNSVPDLNVRGCHLIAASPQPVFDFSNVTTTDNAGIALLLAWTRYARSLNKIVWFVSLPKQLLDIIKVSGLNDILPIQPE